jgi:uncharacterized protein (TIGR03435 family)
MTRTCIGFAVLGLLLSGPAFAQAPQMPPAFEAADVHVRARSSNPNPFMTGGVLRAGRYDLRNATMLDLIRTAYDVDPETILGGPSWLEVGRYDLVAKAPATATQETARVMLQTLLADRFKLVIHPETKPQSGYALTASAQHKLQQATGAGVSGCQPQPPPPAAPGSVPSVVLSCRNVTIASFARTLRQFGLGYIELPVTDMTGLSGSWDFELKWTPRALMPTAGADGVTLSDAIDQQLGLKIALQNISTAVLVVDSVNERPTDNPSGVAEGLPAPPPAEFEVAEIKLSAPDTRPNGRLQPGGRIDFQGLTLRQLVNLAWDINDDQLVAGAPKWFDDTRYSLVARASTAVAGAGDTMQIDIDDLRLMLRSLLIERFKMATHYEDRPVNAYTLVAVNPKLTKADPSNRTRYRNGPALNQRDPRDANPIVGRMVTVQNMTMAQFADNLQRMAPGYLRMQVADDTGAPYRCSMRWNGSSG